MKRLLLVIIVIMLTISCTTKDIDRELDAFFGAEEVIERWVDAVKSGNPDEVGSLYWENAVLVIHSPDREPLELAGLDRIMHQFDKSRIGMVNSERIPDSPDSHPVFLVHFENSPNIQFLMLSNRDGEWRIQEHTIETEGKSPGVAGSYQAWADFNGNGQIEQEELEELINAVRHLLTGPHDISTPLDELFDYNHDGFIDPGELERARQEYFGFLIHRFGEEAPDAARELYDLNGDGRSEPEERRLALEIIFNPDEINVMERLPDEAIRLFDRNRDGRVEEFEVRETRFILLEILALAPLEERKMMEAPRRVVNYLDELADLNSDGTVDEEENMMLMRGLEKPHPVENPFDERLDTNHNGEVEPFEIVRARRAGNLEGGEEEIVKRLESMEDKKLAVVGLNNQIETLSKQTIAGLVVFVENAFVNVGKVKVVDRQNIAKIMEEQKFQLSGITDESTAVEIGKLAGADIIVIGSMSYVGSMYYLNIKMIGVETAQILGSSISQASDDTGFLNMCNDAVYKLFLE